MVRKRKRTTERGDGWGEHEMSCAINDVRENGMSQREVSKRYEIPLSTLRDRLKSGDCTKVNLGRKPVFTKEQEEDIAKHVLLLAKTFYGISAVELRRLVFEYAEANEIQHTFNKSTKMAGPDWLIGFLRRNSSISVRKPEATSLNRISAFNSNEVKLFFSNLSSMMEIHKFDASRIYNFDETGISTVQKPGKILAPKGAKQVGSATSWERGKNITVCCAVSASGTYVPPMFIFPRQRMTPALERGGPPNSVYQCTKNGWMTEDLFPRWLKHFAEFTKSSKDNTVLLIMDNHTSHVTLEAYNFCKNNGIVVVTLPPHCSHRLQPLDVTIFSSLKAAFNQECDNFMRTNPYQKITPYDICPIFTKAYSRIANIEKGVSGFSKTGIYPFDPTKFTEDDFVQLHQEEEPNFGCPVIEEDDAATIDRATDFSIPTTSSRPAETAFDLDDEEEDPENQPTIALPFKDISPLPVLLEPKKSGRKQHSTIFTLTPNKDKLEKAAVVKKEKLQKKENKANSLALGKSKFKVKGKSKPRKYASKVGHQHVDKKKCRRNISFESSSEDDHLDPKKLCNDEEIDDIDPADFRGTPMKRSNTDKDSVCLLCGEFGKNKELWFRCVFCSGWVHAECSGYDTAENFVCDFCKN